MQISDESIEEFKEIYRKKYGKEMDDAEARDSARRLLGFFEILMKGAEEDAHRKDRLKKEPEGFPLEGQRNCRVCYTMINIENSWYDKFGQKCLDCQRAMKEGAIPTFVAINRDSFYLTWELKSKFAITHQTAKKYIREGKLVAREIKNSSGKVHDYIFLKKENPTLMQYDRFNPARKSYDKNRKKVSDAWAKKKSAEWAEKFKKKRKPRTIPHR